MAQQEKARLIGPVEVVEHEDERPVARGALESRDHRPEQLEAGAPPGGGECPAALLQRLPPSLGRRERVPGTTPPGSPPPPPPGPPRHLRGRPGAAPTPA